MGKDKKTPITINDKEYSLEDMNPEQQTLLNHCVDLTRKLDSMKFNMDQLMVGREAFIARLAASLEAKPEDIAAE